jgi:DNA-directed RNA polymerase subunit alpha
VLIAQRPTLTEITESDTRSQFVIGPLEPGFGYTLGNSIRRTLLSSIPGAAVTRFRVTGAAHEFTSLTGVHEDVTEIILNLKSITVSSEHDEPVVAYLRKKGAGAATAADITAPAGVEVHNPELHIATLSKEGNLEIELTIERGRGYVSVDQNKIAGAPIGTIAIDSIYSPVMRVTYRVEATRAGERTDFDKLVIDVETKASIAPRDAVASAGGTLVELFGLARELNVEAEGIEIGPRYEVEVTGEGLDIRIEELDLTVRSFNCLKREGINTLAQLVNLTEHQLMNIRNFGQKSVDEVLEKLAERELQLKDGVPGTDSAHYFEANEK